MSSHSNAASLAATLQQRQAEDRQQIEAATKYELTALANALKQHAADELRTTLTAIRSDLKTEIKLISDETATQTKPLRSHLAALSRDAKKLQAWTLRAWLRPVVSVLSLLLGICGGSWGLAAWLGHKIQSQLEAQAAVTQQIEAQQQTLERLQARTWGVEFKEDESGRYLILPPGTTPANGYAIGQRQAVKIGKN